VLVLLIFIYGITAVFLARAGPSRPADLWARGFLWMALTIVSELVFFGVFLGVPIPELLAAYNIVAGELWIVRVVGVLLAPRLVQAASACFAGTAEVYRWPDARRRMPSASRSRAAGRSRPSWCRSARAASRA
jgi:hypothetical protein